MNESNQENNWTTNNPPPKETDTLSAVEEVSVLPFSIGNELVKRVQYLPLLKIIVDAIQVNNTLDEHKVENNIARGLQKRNGWTVLWSLLCDENQGELRGYSFFQLKETADPSKIITRFSQSIERILSHCRKAKDSNMLTDSGHEMVVKEGAELFELMQIKKAQFKEAQTISRAHNLA